MRERDGMRTVVKVVLIVALKRGDIGSILIVGILMAAQGWASVIDGNMEQMAVTQ